MKTIRILAVAVAVVAVLLIADMHGASGQPPCDPYADAVVSYSPGGDVVGPGFDDPTSALGARDGTYHTGNDEGVSLGHGGSIVLHFVDNLLVDGAADDLRVYEDRGAAETVLVEVSADGVGFVALGEGTGTASFDLAISGVAQASFVRITDVSWATGAPAAGYDLDAVEALNFVCPRAAVGGIVEMQVNSSGSAVDSAVDSRHGSAPGNYVALAALAAAALVALTAGAWYARRRWLR